MNLLVLVPVYNEDKNILRKTLMAVKAAKDLYEQNRRGKVLVWVVDDGSKINLTEAIKDDFPDFKFMRLDHQGKARVQTLILKRFGGSADIFVNVDSDCVVMPNAFEELVKCFERTNADAVYPWVRMFLTNTVSFLMAVEYDLSFLRRYYEHHLEGAGGTFFAVRIGAFRQIVDDYVKNAGVDEDKYLLELLPNSVVCKDSIAYTYAPNSFLTLLKQQIRWKRTAFLTLSRKKAANPNIGHVSLLNTARTLALATSFLILPAVVYLGLWIMAILQTAIYFHRAQILKPSHLVSIPLYFLMRDFISLIAIPIAALSTSSAAWMNR